MEELAALVDTATATDNDAVVAHDEAHSDTSAGSGDASEDSEWGPDSEGECSCGNEIQTSDSEVNEDSHTVATSINLKDGDLRELVTRLIQEDPCDKKCLKGKAKELEQFLCSLSQMTSGEKKQSILTTLAVLKKTDTVLRHRDHGLREQFNFYLPLVGQVCRTAWCKCYGISTATVTRYRKRINDGTFSVKAHGNRLNQNASAVDLRWLVSWFKQFAVSVGDVVPVRVRRKETKEGEVKMYYSDAEYTLLPAYFTWDQLYTEMHNYVEELALRVREPRPSTFRQYLTKLCPTIRIRSPRSNVCDVCSIYWSRMKSGATAAETEAFGEHTTAARRMREEYKSDLAAADDTHAVIIIDFSQNLTLPSVSNTPSQWYFLSLRNVNMFGVFYANKNIQYNYVYDESVAGKGTDEVNSMLHHFISQIVVPAGYRKLTIYADNCGGQNKNNFVVRMLLALVHTSQMDEINLKFFVKGHTKNAVDRGFGHVRKHIARADVWTMDQLLGVVNEASSSSALVHIPHQNTIFKVYRDAMEEAYKKLKDIQKYQIFTMRERNPGAVECRKSPDSDVVTQDLRRVYDGITTNATRVHVLLTTHLEALQNPPPNSEKILSFYNKVRPFVPEEFQNDPLYDPPNDEDERRAKQIQKDRQAASKRKKREREAAVATSSELPDGKAVPHAKKRPRKETG